MTKTLMILTSPRARTCRDRYTPQVLHTPNGSECLIADQAAPAVTTENTKNEWNQDGWNRAVGRRRPRAGLR